MMSVLKALAVTAAIAFTLATYLYQGKGFRRYGEVAKSDWILIGIVLGALFLTLVYGFSR
jgi:hypothetical protein